MHEHCLMTNVHWTSRRYKCKVSSSWIIPPLLTVTGLFFHREQPVLWPSNGRRLLSNAQWASIVTQHDNHAFNNNTVTILDQLKRFSPSDLWLIWRGIAPKFEVQTLTRLPCDKECDPLKFLAKFLRFKTKRASALSSLIVLDFYNAIFNEAIFYEREFY